MEDVRYYLIRKHLLIGNHSEAIISYEHTVFLLYIYIAFLGVSVNEHKNLSFQAPVKSDDWFPFDRRSYGEHPVY